MSQFDVNNLSDLDAAPYSTSIIADAKVQSAGPMQAAIRDINGSLGQLNDAFQALGTFNSGGSPPTVERQGGIYFDTGLTQWLGDPDGAGYDTQLADELQGYLADFANAGTGTFRLGGPINVDTAGATLDAADEEYKYTIPADTLSRDGAIVSALLVQSAGTAGNDLGVVWGSDTIAAFFSLAGSGGAVVETMVVRDAAGSQKSVAIGLSPSDGQGSVGKVVVSSHTQDETAAIDFGAAFETYTSGSRTMSFGVWQHGA